MQDNIKLLKTFITEVINGTMRGGRRFDAPGNLRYGVPTTGHTGGNILQDEEEEEERQENKPKAACCLIRSKDGKILGVSRKDDPTDFGMPGGKVDPGETFEQAAARELKEETGLDATNLKQIFSYDDKQGYHTVTFACTVSGKIDTDEDGVVKWVSPSTLLNGSFSDYNQKLFSKIGIS